MAAIVDINIYDLSATILVPIPSTDLDEKGVIMPKIGTDLKISCKAKGIPSPRIDWFKNNKSIFIIQKQRSEIQIKTIGESSILLLRNLTITDSGNYTCRALNDNGNISKWIYVNVVNNSYNEIHSTTQFSTDLCNQIKCLNGKCMKANHNNNNTLVCRCMFGYYGDSCQHKITSIDSLNSSEGCRGLFIPKSVIISYKNIFLCGVFLLSFMMLLFIILWMIRSRKHCRHFQRNSCEKETQVSSENLCNTNSKAFICSLKDNSDVWLTTTKSPLLTHLPDFSGNSNRNIYSPFTQCKKSNNFYECNLTKLPNHHASTLNNEIYPKPLIQIQSKRSNLHNKDFTSLDQELNENIDYISSMNLEISTISQPNNLCSNGASQIVSIPCTCQFPRTENKLQTMV